MLKSFDQSTFIVITYTDLVLYGVGPQHLLIQIYVCIMSNWTSAAVTQGSSINCSVTLDIQLYLYAVTATGLYWFHWMFVDVRLVYHLTYS